MYNQGLRICNTQTTHLPINIMAYNFWDPSKDSLWGVYEKGQCVYVYCSKLQAQLAAEDIGGQLVEVSNQELPDFWFHNAGLNLIRTGCYHQVY
jgi:hypothetical protein